MLNEGEKCRKTTYSIKKRKPCPHGVRHYLCFNPNRSLDHNASGILIFVLFPNIFYFLVGILSVFAT